MSQTATRMLSLLSLLQGQRRWTGVQLADRLQVSPRTVRNDIERLRGLGYAVEAVRGDVGGYRLGAGGSSLPPLLLDAEEAVAVAVGLRTGVNCIIGGMEETSLRALDKLERVLPSRLRDRVRNLNRYTVPLPGSQPVPVVAPELLTLLVTMCHGRERFRFWYADTPGDEAARTSREVEPYRLVNRGHRWYLLGFDVIDGAWEVYELDRIRPRTPNGPRFRRRELPAEDLAAYVARRVPESVWRHRGTVTLHAPARDVVGRIAPAEGVVEPVDDHSCTVRIGAESLGTIALVLGRLGVDFTVVDPPELVEEVTGLAARYARAIVSPGLDAKVTASDPDGPIPAGRTTRASG